MLHSCVYFAFSPLPMITIACKVSKVFSDPLCHPYALKISTYKHIFRTISALHRRLSIPRKLIGMGDIGNSVDPVKSTAAQLVPKWDTDIYYIQTLHVVISSGCNAIEVLDIFQGAATAYGNS